MSNSSQPVQITFELTPAGQVKASVPGKHIFCSRMGKELPNSQIFAFDDQGLQLSSLLTDAQWVSFLDGECVEVEGSLSTLQYDPCDSIMEEWTKEWPTFPGRYWFCGWLHSNTEEPMVYFVHLSAYGNPFAFLEDHNSLYAMHKDQATGLWMPVSEARLPTNELLEELEKSND